MLTGAHVKGVSCIRCTDTGIHTISDAEHSEQSNGGISILYASHIITEIIIKHKLLSRLTNMIKP